MQYVLHETSVDLEHRDRQCPQAGKRAQAGTKIVQRHAATQLAQHPHEFLAAGEIGNHGILGQLKTQGARVDATRGDAFGDKLREAGVAQRLIGAIDREHHRIVLQQPRVRLQQPQCLAHDPAIDIRHQLVTLRGGQEVIRTDDHAASVHHAQQ